MGGPGGPNGFSILGGRGDPDAFLSHLTNTYGMRSYDNPNGKNDTKKSNSNVISLVDMVRGRGRLARLSFPRQYIFRLSSTSTTSLPFFLNRAVLI